MSRKNNSDTYSYYFDRFDCKMYDFKDKEECLRNYVVYMLNRTQRMFEYEGLPDTIPQRMLEMMLQINGFACFAEREGKLYAFWGGLGGEPDEYYRPTICTVSNPALKFSDTYKIGEDCVIVRNDSFLYGLIPLFRRYASAMVENDLSFRIASINTRITSWITAPDDSTKDAGNKYLKDVEAGDLGVCASNEFLDGIKVQPTVNSQRTFTDLIEYQQYLKASWFNEIGLNANYNMKREKLSTTESQMNNDALLPLCQDMLMNRQQCLDEVNAMFGTNISVSFSSSWEKLIEEFEAVGTDGIVDAPYVDEDSSEFESNQLDSGEVSEDGTLENEGTNQEMPSDGEDVRRDGSIDDRPDELSDTDDGDSGNSEVEVTINIEGDVESVEVSGDSSGDNDENSQEPEESNQLDKEEGDDDDGDGGL